MCCTSIDCWFFVCAAQVAQDVSQQWTSQNEKILLPSRWNDLELAKNKGLDNHDSGGKCLWWRCLAWVRCQNSDPALCFKVGLTKVCSAAGNWLFKSESRRLYEMDAQLPRLYVMPMTCLLGKLSVIQAGNTGTIPYSMRGRAAECYPGGKCDSSEGKGDGSRWFYVNPWTMRWSQIIWSSGMAGFSAPVVKNRVNFFVVKTVERSKDY